MPAEMPGGGGGGGPETDPVFTATGVTAEALAAAIAAHDGDEDAHQFILDLIEALEPGGGGGGSELSPSHIARGVINPPYQSDDGGGQWGFVNDGNSPHWNYMRQSENATPNAYIRYREPLEAGTWRLELWHVTHPNNGIYTVSVDGVVVGTIDGSTDPQEHRMDAVTGIEIAADTDAVIEFKMATAGGGGFHRGKINGYTLTKVAA